MNKRVICQMFIRGPQWLCRLKHDWTDWVLLRTEGQTLYSWHRRIRTCARCGKTEEAVIDYWAD